jgi:hypothetical protein
MFLDVRDSTGLPSARRHRRVVATINRLVEVRQRSSSSINFDRGSVSRGAERAATRSSALTNR